MTERLYGKFMALVVLFSSVRAHGVFLPDRLHLHLLGLGRLGMVFPGV